MVCQLRPALAGFRQGEESLMAGLNGFPARRSQFGWSEGRRKACRPFWLPSDMFWWPERRLERAAMASRTLTVGAAFNRPKMEAEGKGKKKEGGKKRKGKKGAGGGDPVSPGEEEDV